MDENNIDVDVDLNDGLGQIQIADEVIAVIAGTAACEVEGVHTSAAITVDALAQFFGKKSQSKGVKVNVENGEAQIDIDIAINFGRKIYASACDVQQKIKSAVETMTGLKVNVINVNVTGVIVEKPKVKGKSKEIQEDEQE